MCMNNKTKIKRRKLRNKIVASNKRHKNSLKETMEFTHAKEIALRRQMERSISIAFPDPRERKSYIESLLNELSRQIEENSKS